MPPLLTAGSPSRGSGLPTRALRFVLGTWRGRLLGAALALDGVLDAFGRRLPAPLGTAAGILLAAIVVGLAWSAFRWLSDRLLWRIRTKLILSYLFIALVPVVLLTVFFVIAFVLLLLLSGSRLVTAEVDRVAATARSAAEAAIVDLPASDAAVAETLRARLASVRALHPQAAWTLLRRGRVAVAEGAAPRDLPAWWKGEPFASLVRTVPEGERSLGRAVLRVAVSRRDEVLVLDLPADGRFFADLEQRAGIHVFQPEQMPAVPSGAARGNVSSGPATRVQLASGSGLAFVALPPRRDWASGEPPRDAFLPLVFRLQPLDFVRRLSPQLARQKEEWRTLADVLLFALGIVASVFLVMYAVALLLGLFLARSITRGVHELSLGTMRLRHGDFDHAIRVRSRDQLGELAESFNEMSRGLKQLMAEQAEKERLEEELRIARQIQMSLLPGRDEHRMAGLRIAALCLPAAEVGGDYYDLLPLGATRMGVLVADVSGKGTSAALYMAELKGLVLSLSRIYDSPARLLSEANRILAANRDSRSFVTMTYAVVDTAAGSMRYARAGHSPILQLEARTRRTRVLAPAGLGLGLDGGERFDGLLEEVEVRLDPGDCFLFFTDGLSEAMNSAAELFGEDRLRNILEEGQGLDSEEIKERILREVKLFLGAVAPHDDMTLVVLKVVEEERAA